MGGFEFLRFQPDGVVCERVTPTVQSVVRFWIEACVEEDEFVIVNSSNLLSTRANIELGDFLSIIDDTEEQIRREQSRTV